MTRLIQRAKEGERGAYAVLFAILLVAIFAMVALVIDLGQARAQRRFSQSVTDLAATAAITALAQDDPRAACEAAWDYLLSNIPDLPSGGNMPCSSFPTNCTDATVPTDYQVTRGDVVITFRYPVSDADIAPARLNDGTQCERLKVSMKDVVDTFFAGVINAASLDIDASAVARGTVDFQSDLIAALLILDRTACNVLITSGQGSVLVSASSGIDDDGKFVTSPGFIAVDSDASKGGGGSDSCSNVNRWSIDSNNNSLNFIKAEDDPIGGLDAIIGSFAMTPGQTSCSGPGNTHACDPADVSALRLVPQPTSLEERLTRAVVDHKFNCNASYPGLSIDPCKKADSGSTRGPSDSSADYIDRLRNDVGTAGTPSASFSWYPGNPLVWQDYLISPLVVDGTGASLPSGTDRCRPNQSVVLVPAGNWYVNCTGNQSFRALNNTVVTFQGGNIIFGDTVEAFGTLSINTPNASLPPADSGKCPTSQPEAFVYLRSSNLTKEAGGSLVLCNSFVHLRNGIINMGSGEGVLKWIAPFTGPFEDLALWSESSDEHVLGGQAALVVEGIFFTPNATPFKFSGRAGQNQADAQFITNRLEIAGQGTLFMRPNPARSAKTPIPRFGLIR